jgi:cobalt-zinc-cadmium efflux system membrane fusion protein
MTKESLQITVVALGLSLLAGCAPAPGKSARAEAEDTTNPLEIKPDADLQKRIDVGKPEMKSVSTTLRVAGRVEADETRMAHVSAPVTGRIVELDAVAGQHVRKGDVLAMIYGSELSTAQSAFLKAHSLRQVSERAVTRAKQLLDAGVVGSAELGRREAELYQASADLAAAREQLGVLGMDSAAIDKLQSTRSINSMTRVLATIDGIILERRATIGQLVNAVETMFTIADLSNVWLVADVPEQSAGELTVGKLVEAEIPAVPGEKITGRLSFVSAIVNPETRTVRTRMNLPNPRQRFKPAMLTTMTLVDGAQPQLVVPASAVVREENADHVFVQTAPNTFVLRRVKVGDEEDERRVVSEGLTAADQIVIEGAFHLNNERKRRSLGDESGD